MDGGPAGEMEIPHVEWLTFVVFAGAAARVYMAFRAREGNACGRIGAMP
jgi:hypothetical protein